MYKTYENNKFNSVDSDKHWPKRIKQKFQCFPLLTITEHTAYKMQENNGLISSLLKVFAVFEICLN